MWEIIAVLLVFSEIMAFTGVRASASCPITMSPPTVVVRYGDPVSVNCTTSSEEVEGMGWESKMGGTDMEENVNTVTWSVEALNVWEIAPKCYVNLPGQQCSGKLPVTVYKMPDSVTIYESDDDTWFVEGQEYQLLCSIINVAPVHDLIVTWYKGNDIIAKDSYVNTTRTPVSESSSLTITPHRDDHGAAILCKTHLNHTPAGSEEFPMMTSEPYHLNVYYLPTFPSHGEETLNVIMGDSVTINCTAVGNPVPVYSLRSDTLDDMEIKAVHTAILSPGTYTCTASNAVGIRTKDFIVSQVASHRTTFWAIIGGFLGLGLLIIICYVIFKAKAGLDSII